jgi:alkanesulfonate monooxygenase
MASTQLLEVFTTCPPSTGPGRHEYVERLTEVARWSEDAGCTGILVYSDNSVLDPWLVSHVIIQQTRKLCPLIAVQPVYMHPYWVAKEIASLAYVYGRRVYLNMVAGGFKNDLEALNDPTPHDQRYERLIEYTTIVMRLLSEDAPLTYDGSFHRVMKLRLTPRVPPELVPGVFVSGSSEAGVAAAAALRATAIKYPKPPGEEEPASTTAGGLGIRVGIIARPTEAEAWAVAHERFPEDRKGQLTRQLASKVSDSVWHKQLSTLESSAEQSPYWLVPFHNYKTMCPYLVGSYEQVATEMARYIGAGYRTVILDIPPNAEELHHTFVAFEAAAQPVQ